MKKFVAVLVVLLWLPVSVNAVLTSVAIVAPTAGSTVNTNNNFTFNATVVGTNATNVSFDIINSAGTVVTSFAVNNNTADDTVFNTSVNLSTLTSGVYNVTAKVSNSTGVGGVINATNNTVANVLFTNQFFNFTTKTHFINGTIMTNANVSVEIYQILSGPRPRSTRPACSATPTVGPTSPTCRR